MPALRSAGAILCFHGITSPATPGQSEAHMSLAAFRTFIDAAREMGSDALVATVDASGLRGRGGAGFPTAAKWRTILEHGTRSTTPVVVNGAEGEPGTFKDRSILRHTPYQTVEGAQAMEVDERDAGGIGSTTCFPRSHESVGANSRTPAASPTATAGDSRPATVRCGRSVNGCWPHTKVAGPRRSSRSSNDSSASSASKRHSAP